MDKFSVVIHCSIVLLVLFSSGEIVVSIDSLGASASIGYNETLISSQGEFRLGFFNPRSSTRFYLGIWYNAYPTQIVWVANRDSPVNGTSGVLTIRNDGNLVLVGDGGGVVWSTNLASSVSKSVSAQLLDTGNLVLKENSEGSVVWQSFEHPSHAMIAGMKIGWDLRIGVVRNLTSWKSTDDPAIGEYTYGMSLYGLPQIVIWKGSSIQYRSGPWNGVNFGDLSINNSLPFRTTTVLTSDEMYFSYQMRNASSSVVRYLTGNGELQFFLRDNNSENWRSYFVIPQDTCGTYGFCGPNAICTSGGPQRCSCMTGYQPKSQQQWDIGVWSGGCLPQRPFNCSERQHFLDMEGMKMPDFVQYEVNVNLSLEECKAVCLTNCSCTAYANSDASGQPRGCLLWFGDLIDVRPISDTFSNQKLSLRVSASDLVSESGPKKSRKMIIILVTIAVSVCLLSGVLFFAWRRKARNKGRHGKGRDDENFELPYFEFVTVTRATQNYSDVNKIGEGGFGRVYKGRLENGQDIAVKRLSETSNQGLDEFKNEVVLIAKLQHRNLVRLLGCCIHGDERMLVYEYMPNGSLDSYIFGGSFVDSHLLAWRRRFAIITGIARGLLYLHRDSRLRVIHRDLKASNVLLDSEMNPKISDFGMARAFGEDQLKKRTQRVVGTYGYMAPEYAIDGVYSMKSDVFSFGVLVLEIVCGKRNNQFQHADHDFNLLGHAWQLWLGGRATELIDPLMEDSFAVSEVLRCIQVGLLCVQQRPEDRPPMPAVLLMLDSESAMLPQPKRPGYYTERFLDESEKSSDRLFWTVNDLTNTMVRGR